MLKLKWDEIKPLEEKTASLQPDNPVCIDFILHGKNPETRRIEVKGLMTFMWRLFDHRLAVDHVRVSLPNGELLFHYSETGVISEKKPEEGNGDAVLYFNKRTEEEQKALMTVLWSQIASALFPLPTGNE